LPAFSPRAIMTKPPPRRLRRHRQRHGGLVWLMNGTAIASGVVLPAVNDPSWRIGGPR